MSDIRAVVFDVNGTLVDIRTDEHDDGVFRRLAHTLVYVGITVRANALRHRYFAIMDEQRATSAEEHPEFDAVAIWARIVDEHATAFTRALPASRLEWLPLQLTETYRALSRHRLRRYPHVRGVLDALARRLPLAVVTDGQSAWALGELHHVGLAHYFPTVVVSGDHGYRKPDRRLFQHALDALGVAACDALYVGNDMHRDVYGAREAGMRTALYTSGHGAQSYRDTVPDHIIGDHRELLAILG